MSKAICELCSLTKRERKKNKDHWISSENVQSGPKPGYRISQMSAPIAMLETILGQPCLIVLGKPCDLTSRINQDRVFMLFRSKFSSAAHLPRHAFSTLPSMWEEQCN